MTLQQHCICHEYSLLTHVILSKTLCNYPLFSPFHIFCQHGVNEFSHSSLKLNRQNIVKGCTQ